MSLDLLLEILADSGHAARLVSGQSQVYPGYNELVGTKPIGVLHEWWGPTWAEMRKIPRGQFLKGNRWTGPGSVFDRFWCKVQEDPISGCWIWIGARKSGGYGHFKLIGKTWIVASRYSYRQWVGAIPNWLELDHLCRNRSCVNPAHLEAVTHKENTERGVGGGADIQRSKTHCPKGHPYTITNTYINSRGARECRRCRKVWRRRRYELHGC